MTFQIKRKELFRRLNKIKVRAYLKKINEIACQLTFQRFLKVKNWLNYGVCIGKLKNRKFYAKFPQTLI